MAIDIIFLLFLVLGFFLGFSRGVVSSLFSFIALFLGVNLAIKWTHSVTLYINEWANIHGRWVPLLAFILLFIVVIIIVHLLSKLIEKSISAVGLGFLDKFAGAILWCLILTFIFSTLLWFGDQLHWINDDVKTASNTYKYLQPIAPTIFSGFSHVIPWFKDGLEKLEKLISRNTPPPPGHK